MADFQRAVFKVADKLQRDQLAINVQEIEKGFRDGQKAIPSALRSPQILQRRRPGTSRSSTGERGTWNGQTLNKGVREVLRAIRWYRKHPNATERDLMQIRQVLRDFPSTLDIRAIPTLVLWGDVLHDAITGPDRCKIRSRYGGGRSSMRIFSNPGIRVQTRRTT